MKIRDNLEAEELKREMYEAAGGKCKHCRKRISFSVAQLAHRIPKTKRYLKKYGPEVIHHQMNMDITCDRCNSKSLLDPKTHPVETAQLITEIQTDIGDIY